MRIRLLLSAALLCALPLAAQGAWMCGLDLNGDGYLDGPGETALCLALGDDPHNPAWFCPLGSRACLEQCPEPLEFSAQNTRCEQPLCPAQSVYDPVSGRCLGANGEPLDSSCAAGELDAPSGLCVAQPRFVCPLGEQYACLDAGAGQMRCSAATCVDVSLPESVIEEPWSGAMHLDDGARDASGSCLGELYIFSGKNSKCRPPGVTVGLTNNCCRNDAQVLSDSTTGVSLSQMITGVQTAYEMSQVAYYGYQVASGAYAATSVGTQLVVTNVATGSAVTSFGATSAVGQGVASASQAAAAGAGTQGALGAGMSTYAGALLNPTTIAVAAAVHVAMQVLFGDGCGRPDVEAALLDASGYCRYLGQYCERRWSGIGCVQRARGFCCFNSKLARIIHEQGRPQLKSFGPDGGWGHAQSPNCRGFTPEEFQMLDFARIDLSEYFGHIQRGLQERLPEARQTIERRIEEHYRMIR
ncbi:conjugal transfer protein TraN [Geoalkalibacter halelectricus]|uniref:Conjugal transfer protein TraN n=1 Tax=Geoalkalibacter halelectricus TaxID=2847045 RepID=A0ABY5ZN83_9BACT|nr:conjugal transfer protein TraN [Geoalkalibacter halelectricus]MDO3377086.1 conjugal transfer protein TraN [Geoalkalibacter halelectricus]UWZ79417.1 conjugal transfer protein TraN [Geoalkalibacter halelectricus]